MLHIFMWNLLNLVGILKFIVVFNSNNKFASEIFDLQVPWWCSG